LINKIKTRKIEKNDPIYCDSAEPDRIEEIRRAGYNSKSSDKEVLAGIDYVKSLKLHVMSDSDNIIKELNSYVWEVDKDNRPLDRPVKFNDHCADAIRMALFTHCSKRVDVRVRYI
jgi:phage terminase large subunit